MTDAVRDILTSNWSYEARFRKTTVTHTHRDSPAQHGTSCITDSEIETCRTRNLLPFYTASLANYHIEIRFGRRNGDGSSVAGVILRQSGTFDDVSLWKAIGVHILLLVNYFLRLVTKLWDMIIGLGIFNSFTHHANILDSKLAWWTTKILDINV